MSENTRTNVSIPNKAFDMEYSTQTKKEMLYLKEHGIYPCFKKRTADYNIPTYKYKKTSELFKVVADYYEQVELEKQMDALRKHMKDGMTAEEFLKKVLKDG